MKLRAIALVPALLVLAACGGGEENESTPAAEPQSETVWGQFGTKLTDLGGSKCSERMSLTQKCIDATPERAALAAQIELALNNEPTTANTEAALLQTSSIAADYRDFTRLKCETETPGAAMPGTSTYDCAMAGISVDAYFNTLVRVTEQIG